MDEIVVTSPISVMVASFEIFPKSSERLAFITFIGHQVFADGSVSVLPTQCFIDPDKLTDVMKVNAVITFTEFTVMGASVHIKVLA